MSDSFTLAYFYELCNNVCTHMDNVEIPLAGNKKQKYDEKLTRIWKMRVTEQQLEILKDVSPRQYEGGGMASVFRDYIVYSALLFVFVREGVWTPEQFGERIARYVRVHWKKFLSYPMDEKLANDIMEWALSPDKEVLDLWKKEKEVEDKTYLKQNPPG